MNHHHPINKVRFKQGNKRKLQLSTMDKCQLHNCKSSLKWDNKITLT